jgi:hypothetical protein
VRLTYFPANLAYAFTFGRQLVRLEGWPLFFDRRAQAVEAAHERGLGVDRYGTVEAIERSAA